MIMTIQPELISFEWVVFPDSFRFCLVLSKQVCLSFDQWIQPSMFERKKINLRLFHFISVLPPDSVFCFTSPYLIYFTPIREWTTKMPVKLLASLFASKRRAQLFLGSIWWNRSERTKKGRKWKWSNKEKGRKRKEKTNK